MAFLSGLSGISAAIGAAGSLVSGFAALSAGNYQNKVAQMNAKIAEDNAQRAMARSQVEGQDQDALTSAMLGEQEAIQASSGVSLTSKSSMLTRRAARVLGRRDTLNVRQAGELEAYGYKTDAVNQRAQGQLAKMSGQSNMLGGFLGATGSLVGSAQSVRSPSRYTSTVANDPWVQNGRSLRRRTA